MDDSSRPSVPADLSLSWIRSRLSRGASDLAAADPASLLALDAEAKTPPRRAAVAAILREVGGGPEVLLIRRAEHPSDPWSGHMAFPGGREDPADPDLFVTAVRETREELALDLIAHGRLIGRLDEIPAVARGRRTGLLVHPYVFELTADTGFVPNAEVAETLWAPLLPLMRGELLTTVPYELEGRRLNLPAHDVEGRIVWGLTFRMLDSLFARLR